MRAEQIDPSVEGWRASAAAVDNSDGGISDEYSDDDDPGYRIVLVEDVGELYPDVSYRMRNRLPDPHPASPSNPDVTGKQLNDDDEEDRGDEDEDEDDADHDDEQQGASEDDGPEDSSSGLEDDLVQRLQALSSSAVPRLPHRQESIERDELSPPSPSTMPKAVASEPVLVAEDSNTASASDKIPTNTGKKARDKSKADDAIKDAPHRPKKAEEEELAEDLLQVDVEGEVGVDAEELAAHHMPDLIEGHQPMFSPPPTGSATASAHAAASKPKLNGVTAWEDPAAASAGPPPAEEESVAAETPACPPAKDETAQEKSAQDTCDETVYYDCFDLKIVYERNRTGFEETKDFPIEINGVIAGRYQILEFLGAAAFSKAVQCVDLTDGSYVCIKIIKNNKDFFDQSLDEIKILKYLNAHDTRDDHHLLQLYDYFYFKEHLFIVTELLRDNLYEFSKFNRESGADNYFTLARLQKITRECLEGLKFVHQLRLIHCDLKPENILIRSYSRCEIKIIDFGSSCFVTDHLTSYVQSRSYRAPEVILGLPYDELIDMWSLGCILAELWTGRVLFQNDSLATLLARVVGILGGIDEDMLVKGRYTHRFFTKHKILYDRLSDEERSLVYIFPKRTSLQHRLASSDALFVDFISKLLEVNPSRRLSAEQALQHAWLGVKYS